MKSNREAAFKSNLEDEEGVKVNGVGGGREGFQEILKS